MDMFPGGCGPITSIRQCNTPQPSAFVVIWSTKVTTIAGVEMTILEILQKLHEPPAPWQVDARFHSALTAGSVSSPDLSVAFGYPTADLLDAQLNASMATWLQNPRKGSLLHQYVPPLVSINFLKLTSFTNFCLTQLLSGKHREAINRVRNFSLGFARFYCQWQGSMVVAPQLRYS